MKKRRFYPISLIVVRDTLKHALLLINKPMKLQMKMFFSPSLNQSQFFFCFRKKFKRETLCLNILHFDQQIPPKRLKNNKIIVIKKKGYNKTINMFPKYTENPPDLMMTK